MKVLALITANRNSWHYIISDSVEAFKELGHEVNVVPIINHRDSIQTILRNIGEFKPDFIFTANNVGLYNEVLDRVKIPILSWITTEPQVLSEITPTENLIYLVVGESYIDEMKKRGHKKVFLLLLAANPGVFRKIPLSDADQKRYGCDISFAGGCNYDIWYKRHKEGIDQFFSKEVVEKLIQRHSRNTSTPIIDDLMIILMELGRVRDVDISLLRSQLELKIKEELVALHWAAMSKFRKDVITEIKDFGVNLYGDEGWKDFENLPGVRLYSFIEDRRELVKLYNATRINLNLPTAMHLNLTTFNIPACGAFMISKFSQELVNLFREREEVVYFRRREELPEMVRYYLTHPEERRRIASNAQRRVLNEHTFVHRMKEVIRIIERI